MSDDRRSGRRRCAPTATSSTSSSGGSSASTAGGSRTPGRPGRGARLLRAPLVVVARWSLAAAAGRRAARRSCSRRCGCYRAPGALRLGAGQLAGRRAPAPPRSRLGAPPSSRRRGRSPGLRPAPAVGSELAPSTRCTIAPSGDEPRYRAGRVRGPGDGGAALPGRARGRAPRRRRAARAALERSRGASGSAFARSTGRRARSAASRSGFRTGRRSSSSDPRRRTSSCTETSSSAPGPTTPGPPTGSRARAIRASRSTARSSSRSRIESFAYAIEADFQLIRCSREWSADEYARARRPHPGAAHRPRRGVRATTWRASATRLAEQRVVRPEVFCFVAGGARRRRDRPAPAPARPRARRAGRPRRRRAALGRARARRAAPPRATGLRPRRRLHALRAGALGRDRAADPRRLRPRPRRARGRPELAPRGDLVDEDAAGASSRPSTTSCACTSRAWRSAPRPAVDSELGTSHQAMLVMRRASRGVELSRADVELMFARWSAAFPSTPSSAASGSRTAGAEARAEADGRRRPTGQGGGIRRARALGPHLAQGRRRARTSGPPAGPQTTRRFCARR